MNPSRPADRDRDEAGRPRNARIRDRLGRPLSQRGDAAGVDDVPTLPPEAAVARAQQLLDDGAPFTAHEVLEAVWKATAGPDRELWRGLAQLCVGITHAMRGNDKGATALLGRAADTLGPYAGTTPYQLDVDGLRSWAEAAAARPADAKPPSLTVR